MQYRFEWDPNKANLNKLKHGVDFEQAATVFLDPRAISIFDDAHSTEEDRWLTMGLTAARGLLVVHHTFRKGDDDNMTIRIISSRKATRTEEQQYLAQP